MTVCPYIINTRMEMIEMVDKITEFWPRISPEDAADKTVKAMLADKLNLVIPGQLAMAGIVA